MWLKTKRTAAVRRWLLVLCAGSLVLVAAPQALGQDPPSGGETVVVPADDGGGPSPAPDPAPAPDPGSSGGGSGSSSSSSSGGGSSSSSSSGGGSSSSSSGGGSSSSTSSGDSASQAPPPVSQPSAAELERQRAEARRERQEALRKERERERKKAAELAKAQAAAQQSAFDAFLNAWSDGEDPPKAPAGEGDRGVRADAPTPAADVRVAPILGQSASDSSSVGSATPVLLGLLALAIILLGVAALPTSSIRGAHLAALVAQRRLEIGLVGTAVLASAAIGLLVVVVGA